MQRGDLASKIGRLNPHKRFCIGCSHFGKIDVKLANGVRLESLSYRLVAIDIGQSVDIVTLKAAVEG